MGKLNKNFLKMLAKTIGTLSKIQSRAISSSSPRSSSFMVWGRPRNPISTPVKVLCATVFSAAYCFPMLYVLHNVPYYKSVNREEINSYCLQYRIFCRLYVHSTLDSSLCPILQRSEQRRLRPIVLKPVVKV